MNETEQRIRNLVPEANGIVITTESTKNRLDSLLGIINQHNLPHPGDNIFIAVLSGIYNSRDIEGTLSIAVAEDVAPLFTDEELRTLVLHEVGHVIERHLEKVAQTEGVVNHVQSEIEADQYALATGIEPLFYWDTIMKLTGVGVSKYLEYKREIGERNITDEEINSIVTDMSNNAHLLDTERYNAIFA